MAAVALKIEAFNQCVQIMPFILGEEMTRKFDGAATVGVER
jgi:hypothetical protein